MTYYFNKVMNGLSLTCENIFWSIGRHVCTFNKSVSMLDASVEEDIILIDSVSAIDNVCHDWEGFSDEFFFMYVCLIIDIHIRFPFDELTMGVL